MKNIPSDRRYRNVSNSQKAAVVKEEITYASALRKAGIDEVFVARKLKDLAQAQEWRWNPKKGSWEKFDDFGTQLGSVREIAKILGLYAKDSDDSRVPTLIDISAIPMRREPVPRNGEQSIGTATSDGRAHRERW
jgi:hypothetical protein